METPKGLIIVTQPILAEITQAEILAALPQEWLALPKEICAIEPVTVQHHDINTINWREAAGIQTRLVKETLLPLLEKHPDYLVCYFGAAPIPLAVHLGYRLGTWKRVMVFQQHHKRKDWKWIPAEGEFVIHKEGLPTEDFGGEGVAVIRLGTSYPVKEEDTREIVARPVREIDVYTSPYDIDVFDNMEKLSQVADAFREGMDAIKNHLPATQMVHLFASIPVGLAFLLGTRVNPTIHHRIQTYQFYGNKSPKYEAALVVQDEGRPQTEHTAEQKAAAAELREEILKMFDGPLTSFLQQISERHSRISTSSSWIETLLPHGTNVGPFLSGRWQQLPHVFETILKGSKVDTTVTKSRDFYNAGKWLLDDGFLITLQKRLVNPDDVKRAIRLFFFHEAAHFRTHGLTSTTVAQIGRFARILEEVDYQADVWAMLHEFAYSQMYDTAAVKDACNFFHHLITLASETMWSFDAMEDPDTMQARRINRYLMWYFHFVQVEHENCQTLDDILLHLSEKPLLELKGLRINPPDSDQRIWCRLNDANGAELEIAVLFNNRIRRIANGSVMPITTLIEGLREHNGEKIKQTLRALLDQVV